MHKVINHSHEYMNGKVHTKRIENFSILLNARFRGTHIAVEPFHLDRHLSEQLLIFDNSATMDNPLTDEDGFALAMTQTLGRRLT